MNSRERIGPSANLEDIEQFQRQRTQILAVGEVRDRVIVGVDVLPRVAQAVVADSQGLFAAVYLGIVPSLVAYASWAVALSRLPASRASNFLYCVPPVATLMGFFWLGEAPGALGIFGGGLALVGVAIVNLRR